MALQLKTKKILRISQTLSLNITLALDYHSLSQWHLTWGVITIFPQIASDENLIQFLKNWSPEKPRRQIAQAVRDCFYFLLLLQLDPCPSWPSRLVQTSHLSTSLSTLTLSSALPPQICLIPFWGPGLPDVLHWNTRPPASTVGWVFCNSPPSMARG